MNSRLTQTTKIVLGQLSLGIYALATPVVPFLAKMATKPLVVIPGATYRGFSMLTFSAQCIVLSPLEGTSDPNFPEESTALSQLFLDNSANFVCATICLLLRL